MIKAMSVDCSRPFCLGFVSLSLVLILMLHYVFSQGKGETWLIWACRHIVKVVVWVGGVVDGTRVGLHLFFETLVRESAYLIYPHVTPKF